MSIFYVKATGKIGSPICQSISVATLGDWVKCVGTSGGVAKWYDGALVEALGILDIEQIGRGGMAHAIECMCRVRQGGDGAMLVRYEKINPPPSFAIGWGIKCILLV